MRTREEYLAYQSRYNQSRRDHKREYNKLYHQTHKDQRRARDTANRDHIRTYERSRRARLRALRPPKHKQTIEERRAYQRAYYQQNRAKLVQYAVDRRALLRGTTKRPNILKVVETRAPKINYRRLILWALQPIKQDRIKKVLLEKPKPAEPAKTSLSNKVIKGCSCFVCKNLVF